MNWIYYCMPGWAAMSLETLSPHFGGWVFMKKFRMKWVFLPQVRSEAWVLR